MNMSSPIPKDEQLRALASGLTAFCHLIEEHTGSPIKGDFRQYASVTKAELTEYLRHNPEMARKHLISEDEALQLHDHPVLLADADEWLVCWMDHGRKTNKSYFNDIHEAAANFLMAYW